MPTIGSSPYSMECSGRAAVFWSKWVVISAALAFAGWAGDLLGAPAPENVKLAAGALSSVMATLLGFVLAALAILATIANTRLVRNMRRTGHYFVLLQRMYGCIVACGAGILLAVTLILVNDPIRLGAYLLAGWSCLCAAVIIDMSRKLWMVLTHLNPDAPAA